MDIRIDRLRLQVSGMHPDAARDLGRLLAEHLAAALAAEPLAAQPLARLSVSVPWLEAGAAGRVRPLTAAPAAAAQVSRALRGAAAGRAPGTR